MMSSGSTVFFFDFDIFSIGPIVTVFAGRQQHGALAVAAGASTFTSAGVT